MNAEELYKKSLKATRKVEANPQGLTQRVYNALYRAGYGYDSAEEGLNVQEIYNALLDGTIWAARCIGKKSVKEICQWIVTRTGVPE